MHESDSMFLLQMPSSVKKGSDFEAAVSFTNPLPEELTECKAGYEGGGFKHVTGIKQDMYVNIIVKPVFVTMV